MEIKRSGIILNTENYEDCVRFYKDLFKLKIIYREDEENFKLTCFEFFGSYLMVETGGTACKTGRLVKDSPTKIRINVADIDDALRDVKSYGLNAEIRRSAWGSTIDIIDPDGNRVGIRDEKTFVDQLQ